MNSQQKQHLSTRRHWRVRKKVVGTPKRPRMSVKFSNQHVYVQFIDDTAGRTIAAIGSRDKDLALAKSGANVFNATVIGRRAGEVAKLAGVTQVVFDRGGARYHGKVKALADAARSSGLKF